jgi:16S rRNA (uracil1498-N3)-methyltransferase
MSRFYVPKEAVQGDKITVTGDEAHHIKDVMRLRVSDKVICFDGTGNEYHGVISDISQRAVIVDIEKTTEQPDAGSFTITLIQSIPKKDKMDYIVEKATELGVKHIIPVMTERTIVDWDQKKKDASCERWRRISLAASKQCGRADVPEISRVSRFKDALKAVSGLSVRLIAALGGDPMPLKEALQGCKSGDIAVAIGPEGDFTTLEIDEARDAGFKLVSLGQRVLKSDTAGLAVLAIINYELSS